MAPDEVNQRNERLYGVLPNRPFEVLAKANPGRYFIPGEALALCSFLVCVLSGCILLSFDTVRTAFALPGSAVPFALLAALLAWRVVRAASRRPGNPLANLWALFVCIASVLDALVVIWFDLPAQIDHPLRPYLHIGASLMLASAAVLAFRLINLKLNSWWLGRMTAVALLVVVPLWVVAMVAVPGAAAARQRARIDSRIEALREARYILERLGGLQWRDLVHQPAEAGRQLAGLEALASSCCAMLHPTAEQWQAARLYGLESELSAEYGGLILAAARAATASNAPLASQLHRRPLEAVGRSAGNWRRNPAFDDPLRIVSRYWASVWKILVALRPSDQLGAAGEIPAPLAGYEAGWSTVLTRLQQLRSSFADRWLVDALPGAIDEVTRMGEPPPNLLRTSVFEWNSEALLAGDVRALLDVPRPPPDVPVPDGCAWAPSYEERKRVNRREVTLKWAMLECFSLESTPGELPARPFAQMRLLWPDAQGALPTLLYYAVSVPDDAPQRPEQFMSYLEDMNQSFIVGRGGGKSMSALAGFDLLDNLGQTITVKPVELSTAADDSGAALFKVFEVCAARDWRGVCGG